MAKNKANFELLSNEWAVPYWLLGIFALLLGSLSYVVHQLTPANTGLFNNLMFLVLLILLSIFYKKLYITRVVVQLTDSQIEFRYLKLFFPVKKVLGYDAVTGLGIARTEAVTGLVHVPEKHWILIQSGKSKVYFYEQNGHGEVKGLFNQLEQRCLHATRVENILK
jgi:hypothetical protein